jgi:hypothetical protein
VLAVIHFEELVLCSIWHSNCTTALGERKQEESLLTAAVMLRITFHGLVHDMKIRMEGRFASTYAEEALKFVLLFKAPSTVAVDISELSFIDEIGEDLLSGLGGLGVKFVADSLYAFDVCERLHLQVVGVPLALSQAM